MVVDDSSTMRLSLKQLLRKLGIQIVAESGTGSNVVELYKIHRPTLVMLDIVLPECDGVTLAQSILGLIQGQDFTRRDSNERAAFFEALGRCGSDSLVPRLEVMLTKGGLFRSGGNEEERLHAALALAWLGTPAAIAILNREIGSKRDFVRKAVETALASVRSAGMGRAEGSRAEDQE